VTDHSDLSVRPWQDGDIPSVINYFLDASEAYIRGLGADPEKLPIYDKWYEALSKEVELSASEQSYFYTIWMLGEQPVGHCNVNFIEYGQKAHMHLHLWKTDTRRSGLGTSFVKKSVPLFFDRFDLKLLICEPYAENPAPNKTLPRAGFSFVKKYHTTPGPINFPQDVCRYRIDKKDVNVSR